MSVTPREAVRKISVVFENFLPSETNSSSCADVVRIRLSQIYRLTNQIAWRAHVISRLDIQNGGQECGKLSRLSLRINLVICCRTTAA